MINDLIADSITRIRNASMRKLPDTSLIHSNIVESTIKIFQEKGYIDSYSVFDDKSKKGIKVILKYLQSGASVINEVKRVSKPGRRVYKGKCDVKRFKNGYGTIIISSSKGVIDNEKAKELGVGGEVLCTIW